MRKHILIISLILVALFSLSCNRWSAYSVQIDTYKRAESVLNVVMTKLDLLSKSNNFDLDAFFNTFYGIEANRKIVGLESERDIERFWRDSAIIINGEKQYDYHNKWCFVVAQLIKNYLTFINVESYALAIRGPKFEGLFLRNHSGRRIRWDYHMVAIAKIGTEEFVSDPSHKNKIELLKDYTKRFENPKGLRLKRLKTIEEIDLFIHPVRGFRPRTMFGVPLGIDMRDVRIPIM